MAKPRPRGAELPKLAFRVDELSYSLGIGETKIRDLIDKGELGCVRIGTALLVTMDQALAFIRKRQAASGWLGG